MALSGFSGNDRGTGNAHWYGGSSRFEWNYSFDEIAIRKGLTKDFYKEVAEMEIEYFDPYVPYKEGNLSAYVQAFGARDHATVTYQMPYASKQYYGENVNEANRCRQFHPLATSYWDEAAWNNSGTIMTAEINEIRKRHAI